VALTRLTPPKWRPAFGTPGDIDIKDDTGAKLSPDAVLKAGSALFTARCAGCHTPHQTYETMVTFAGMQKGGNLTDEWMACNAWDYTGASGALNGVPADYLKGAKLGPNAQVAALLTTSVKGTLVGKKLDVVKIAAENFFGTTPLPRGGPQAALVPGQTEKDQRLQRCLQLPADQQAGANLAYKARPLEGIWATAPYLHNGSVPTLYDLLQPVERRPATFLVGTRAFDPKKVGYDTAPGASGNSFTFDTSLPGNANKGHVYGVGALTEAQRLQLLEYLKTL
jgi:mono/diheme cytochrome c family protein